MKGSRDQNGSWAVRLLCCGRDAGTERFATWEDADQYRKDYIDAEGHQRVGVLTRYEKTSQK